MTSIKPFGILVEAQGVGVEIAGIAKIGNAEIEKRLNPTPIGTHVRQVHANLGWLGMAWDGPPLKSTPIWDG